MFDIYCEKHGARVLLWSDCITILENRDDHMIVLHWRCPCGQTGIRQTGRQAFEGRESTCTPI